MGPLHWPQPIVRHSSLCSASPSLHILASAFTTDVVFCRNYHQRSDLPAVTNSVLHSSRSRLSLSASIPRAFSASLDAFSDDDDGFFFNSGGINGIRDCSENCRRSHSSVDSSSSSSSPMLDPSMELEINREPPDWFGRDELEIEQKAKCLDLPLSIQIMKKKRQQQVRRQQLRKVVVEEGVHDQSCCGYLSMKRAFSSMVLIIQELNSYALRRLKELLVYYDVDLQEMRMIRVQREIQESFILIFKQVFSRTPPLMLFLMILYADFSVNSVLTNPALSQSAANPAQDLGPAYRDEDDGIVPKLHSSSEVKTSTFSVSGEKTSAVVGGMGGDGNSRPVVTSGADGEGGWVDDSSDIRRPIVPEAKGDRESKEKELMLWNSILEEAQNMRWDTHHHHHHKQQQKQLVSRDSGYDEEELMRTELGYVMGLAQDTNNPLLLANFAQFLCLVARDYDRAEEYFKRATEIEPKDAEALNNYASFLWQIRNDLWAAEETFLEAITADPGNTFYASNYANFLWNTGGTDTCYPLDGPEEDGPDVEGGFCL